MRKNAFVVVAMIGLLLGACGGEPAPKTAPPNGSAAPECLDLTGSPTAEITMVDNTFEPACFTVSDDQTLTIRNEGIALHNFSVKGTDVDLDVPSGEATNTEAVGGILQPGDYQVTCKYHPEMVAELRLR